MNDVVADTHAVIWYLEDDAQLGTSAGAQFNGNAYQFRCWLIRIVRNTCMNQQRFATRQAKGMLHFREAEVYDWGPPGNLIRPLEQSLIDAELRQAIERAIAGLSQVPQAVAAHPATWRR